MKKKICILMFIFIAIALFFDKNSFSQNIEIYPSINHFKEYEKINTGKMIGTVKINEETFCFFDSSKTSNKIVGIYKKPYHMLLYDKSVEVLNQKIDKHYEIIKGADEIYKKIDAFLASADLIKTYASFVTNFANIPASKTTKDVILNTISAHTDKLQLLFSHFIDDLFKKDYGEDSFMMSTIYPLVKENIFSAISLSVTYCTEKDTCLKIFKDNFKPLINKSLAPISRVIAWADFIIKVLKLENVTAVNWYLLENNEHINIALFKHEFIQEYIKNNCNISYMANLYNANNFFEIFYRSWKVKRGRFLNSIEQIFYQPNGIEFKKQLAIAAEEALNLIEKYGDGGIYNLELKPSLVKYLTPKSVNGRYHSFHIEYKLVPNNSPLYMLNKDFQDFLATTVHTGGSLVTIFPKYSYEIMSYHIDKSVNFHKNVEVSFYDTIQEVQDVFEFSANIMVEILAKEIKGPFSDSTVYDKQLIIINKCFIPKPSYIQDINLDDYYGRYIWGCLDRKLMEGSISENFYPNNPVRAGDFLRYVVKIFFSSELSSKLQILRLENDIKKITPFEYEKILADIIIDHLHNLLQRCNHFFNKEELYEILFDVHKDNFVSFIDINISKRIVVKIIYSLFYTEQIVVSMERSQKFQFNDIQNKFSCEEQNYCISYLKGIGIYLANPKSQTLASDLEMKISKAECAKLLLELSYVKLRKSVEPYKPRCDIETLTNCFEDDLFPDRVFNHYPSNSFPGATFTPQNFRN